MAALAILPRPAARTPGRPPRVRSTSEAALEPPSKRQKKYIPGGPGGGGRWLDHEGRELPATEAPARVRPPRLPTDDSGNPREDDGLLAVSRSALHSRPRRERERVDRYAPQVTTPRPRYSSAAAAAAASQASDGYKPREERSWEDFHPDLDIDASLQVFTADEVDGRSKETAAFKAAIAHAQQESSKLSVNGDADAKDAQPAAEPADASLVEPITATPVKRKPGRPPRKAESMLSGLGSPPAPRIVPLPTHNPKERLNLPKPSFRQFNHFLQYEEDQRENKVNYVDRTMSHVGYQESDRFELPSKTLVRLLEGGQQIEDEAEVSLRLESDGAPELTQAALVVGRVEYDMDEQDVAWLEQLNNNRRNVEGVDAIKPGIFEITMTQIEKEYHALEKRIPKPQPRHALQNQIHNRPRSSSQAAVNGDPNHPAADEPDSKCAICDDGDCENANAIIFCDGCDLAVHQECYGVPFIPEGQWFCRKCREIGRGTPTCVFCPNVDGAFKQTNTLRWSHLLCAIWIPEVTIANMTFMEPITDIDKVPKSRWKLHCYICNQRMGACIQCGNKNCYLAFHVTCARRAKLFLKMKSQHQGGIDQNALKAMCDKHVPPEWRRTHDTDNAIVEAKRWYRHAMKERKWADSQMAALELGAPPPPDGGLADSLATTDDTIAVSKRKRTQPSKMSWRLPSGAPVVPAVVFNTVELSLARFTIRKRKEFVEKACRYWTLKREARRGAALLKRLQLQLESFNTMEITRRSFAGMGAAGRPRLLRRIEFAEMLQKDLAGLKNLCGLVKEREELRLREIELLQELVDTVYFPISALLWPVLQKAQKSDEKTRMFKAGFDVLASRLSERYYTSVSDFSHDLSKEISQVLGAYEGLGDAGNANIDAIHRQLNEVKPGTAEHTALTQEQKEVKKLAKRIVKAVKEALESATKKEADLKGREHEEELRKLDSMGIFASSKSIDADEGGDEVEAPDRQMDDEYAVAGASPADGDAEMLDADERTDDAVIRLHLAGGERTVPVFGSKTTPTSDKPASRGSSSHQHHDTKANAKPTEPLSPPISTDLPPRDVDVNDTFTHGGVPWYLEPFDPVGTTVHEERYTGRAVLRAMSEELSDMDEDTLTELAGSGMEKGTPIGTNGDVKARTNGYANVIDNFKTTRSSRSNSTMQAGLVAVDESEVKKALKKGGARKRGPAKRRR